MSETAEDLRARLDEKLRQGCPKKPKAKPAPVRAAAPAEVVSILPWFRRRGPRPWLALPVGTTNAVALEPSEEEQREILRRQNAVAARRERIRRDPTGQFWDGAPEDIEDLVRQQDERWR